MLDLLLPTASERKLRLFACHCFRLIWDLLRTPGRVAVEVGELLADGLADAASVEQARASAVGVSQVTLLAVCERPSRMIRSVMSHEFSMWHERCGPYPIVFREFFGNPFRPVIVDPSWLTSTVHALAKGIYDEKAFDRMPILADALMDAGCNNEEVLHHCRSEAPHVRGCWLIDSLLGIT